MPTTSSPAVVVVSYRSAGLAAEALGPFAGTRWTRVVVDSFSDVTERDRIVAFGAAGDCTLVLPETNVGFGAGVNAGVAAAAAAGCDAVLVLNPDATIPVEAAEQLVADVVADPHLLVAPAIRNPDGRSWFAGAVLDLRHGRTRRGEPTGPDDIPWLSGACFAASIAELTAVGGFDDRYFLYWEDIDLSWRWQRRGGHLAVRHDLTCVHRVGATQEAVPRHGANGKSPDYHYFNTRNRLLFLSRHISRSRWAGWLTATPAHAGEVLLRGGRRALARHPLRTLWPALRGTLTGLSYLVRSKNGHHGTR